jgi:hypothetical protein
MTCTLLDAVWPKNRSRSSSDVVAFGQMQPRGAVPRKPEHRRVPGVHRPDHRWRLGVGGCRARAQLAQRGVFAKVPQRERALSVVWGCRLPFEQVHWIVIVHPRTIHELRFSIQFAEGSVRSAGWVVQWQGLRPGRMATGGRLPGLAQGGLGRAGTPRSCLPLREKVKLDPIRSAAHEMNQVTIVIILGVVGGVIAVGLGLAAWYDHRAKQRGWRVSPSSGAAVGRAMDGESMNIGRCREATKTSDLVAPPVQRSLPCRLTAAIRPPCLSGGWVAGCWVAGGRVIMPWWIVIKPSPLGKQDLVRATR